MLTRSRRRPKSRLGARFRVPNAIEEGQLRRIAGARKLAADVAAAVAQAHARFRRAERQLEARLFAWVEEFDSDGVQLPPHGEPAMSLLVQERQPRRVLPHAPRAARATR